jgi:hypothetical protein
MGMPSQPKAPPAPPPVASLLDPTIMMIRDRERAKRKSKAGQSSTVKTSPRGVSSKPVGLPKLTPMAAY